MSDAFQGSGGSPLDAQRGRHADPLLDGTVDSFAAPTTSIPSQSRGTADVAKEQAANVRDTGVEAAKDVAGAAKHEVKNVAGEVGSQAKRLLSTAGSELKSQASGQQTRLADGLRSASEELKNLASGQAGEGMATDLVRQVGDRVQTAASWLENREPKDLLDEVTRFARQRPGAFIAIAGAAGFLIGRLGRSLVEEAQDSAKAETAPALHGSQVPTPRAFGTPAVDTTIAPAAGTGFGDVPVPPLPGEPGSFTDPNRAGGFGDPANGGRL